MADQCHMLPRCNVQAEVVQHAPRLVVVEVHLVEMHHSMRYSERLCRTHIFHFPRGLEDYGHLVGVGQTLIDIPRYAAKVPQPIDEHQHVRLKKHEITERESALLPQVNDEYKTTNLQAYHEEALDRVKNAADIPALQEETALLGHGATEALHFPQEAAEECNSAVVRNRVCQHGRGLGFRCGTRKIVLQLVPNEEYLRA